MPNSVTQLRDSSRVQGKPSALRVLVVDDEPLMRWSVAETLMDSGHDVLEAADGQAAVKTLTETPVPVDVVVLDFRLPDSSDLGLLSKIRHLSPASQVILMTAYGTPELAKSALDLGAFRVVSKPIEMQDLVALVLQAHQSRAH